MASGQAAQTLYKGAAPGTHWHVNDAVQHGFAVGSRPPGHSAILRHIVNYSFPSAYLSFSTSFAVARQYALQGPGGLASASAPGYVYEVDLSVLGTPLAIVDPVFELASAANGTIAHGHDGAGALIAEVAYGRRTLSQAMHCGGAMRAPKVTGELRSIVFAIRDAEVLIGVTVPSAAVLHRHRVY